MPWGEETQGMSEYSLAPKSPFFEVLDGLNRENKSDNKVAMISEIDMSSAQRLRRRLEDETRTRPSYTALVTKAVSLALCRHPHANRIPVRGLFRRRVIQLQHVDMTIAVERDFPGVEQGVFAGTIRQTDEKDLVAITRDLRDLADATPETCERWRLFKWIVEKFPARLALWLVSLPRYSPRLWIEHRGGAAMISSPAKYGVDLMVAAWPWPLGFSFGFVKERAVVVDGAVIARPTMTLTMSFDRRLMAGAPAARFFETICTFLTEAETYLTRTKALIGVSGEYDGDVTVKRRTTASQSGASERVFSGVDGSVS
jgi:2-oxoacid dehydrogenases acyltransferase (catalytic domain)